MINRLLTSKVYDDLFQELYDSAFEFTPDIQSNTYVDRWHFLQLSEVDETNRMEYKRAYVQELAVQFRDYESVPRVSFPWYGVAFVSGGYNTDVSPTCASMVPYVLPGNFSYY